jgi:uracil-DNA glycosylase
MSKWEHLLDVYDSIEEDASFNHLRRPGIRLVRGDGQHNAETARVMLVGKAPGAQENGAGRPFVGQSGMVLEGLLNHAGFWRENVFITNVVKYRPEGNRTPSLREQLDSTPYLRDEWGIIQPALTIAVGAPAHLVLRGGASLSGTRRGELANFGPQRRGKRHYITSQFHPAFGLRNASMRPRMEREWDTLWEVCREVGGILCGECEGQSAREGTPCETCHPAAAGS